MRARELLIHREYSTIEMIAAASGFASVATLRNRFRAEFSMTPNEFRQETSRKNAGRRESRGSDADLGGGP